MMYKITFTITYPTSEKNFSVTLEIPEGKTIDEILNTTIDEMIINQYQGSFHYKIGHGYINLQNVLALSLKAERVESAKIISLKKEEPKAANDNNKGSDIS